MLILSRRIGESLMLGDDIKITVMGVRGNQIRIGIDADKSLPVHRQEVYDKIKASENVTPIEMKYKGGTLKLGSSLEGEQ